MKPTMSSTAAGSRITVYFPAGISRGMRRVDRFLRRDLGQRQRIEIRHVGRIRLLPSGRIGRQHGDGNFGRRLRVPVAQAARVENSFDRFRAGKNAGGRELVFFRHVDNLLDALSPKLGSDRRSLFEVTGRWLVWRGRPRPLAGSFATVGHGQKIRIRMLHFRQSSPTTRTTRRKLSSSNLLVEARAVRPPKTVRTETTMVLFRHILMNGVVGETRKRKAARQRKGLRPHPQSRAS